MIVASAFGNVHDFFHSSAWYVIRNLAIFFVFVFWAATAYWVYKDAKHRITDQMIVWVVTAIGVVPFFGPVIYMLFRPPEYLEDVRERELEIRAIEQRLGSHDLHCPVCRTAVDDDYLVCPVCTTTLRQACSNCQRPLESAWQVCPFCATLVEHEPTTAEVAPAAPKRPPRRKTSS